MVAAQAALHEAPSPCLLLVFHRLPLLMQPMRVRSSGVRVLISLPLFLINTQHLVVGYCSLAMLLRGVTPDVTAQNFTP
jgi:hypothetical protein